MKDKRNKKKNKNKIKKAIIPLAFIIALTSYIKNNHIKGDDIKSPKSDKSIIEEENYPKISKEKIKEQNDLFNDTVSAVSSNPAAQKTYIADNETTNSYTENSYITDFYFNDLQKDDAQLSLLDKYEKNMELTNEEKIDIILIKYGITREEFDTIAATVLMEAPENSYIDAYGDANTMLNRIFSYTYIDYCNSIMGDGTGENIFYQTIFPNAYMAYQTGAYLRFYKNPDIVNLPGYQAVIDCLYSEELAHHCVQFIFANSNVGTPLPGGSIEFFDSLPDSDFLPKEERITYRNIQKAIEEEHSKKNSISSKILSMSKPIKNY